MQLFDSPPSSGPCTPASSAPDIENSIVEAIRRHAAQTDTPPALHFLAAGDPAGPVQTWTVVELDRAARAIAAHLQAVGARGERALLVYAPGLDFIAAFLGCLYAGVIAVPAYPPDPMRMGRTLPRLRAIARDSEASYLLMTSALYGFAGAMAAHAPELSALRAIATDQISLEEAENWRGLTASRGALAFLQYTSGSTGVPRGVMVSHANLVHNIHAIRTACPDSRATRMVSWLPAYHDMGLIGGILTPLVGGFDAILMAPGAFLERPMRWLEAMSQYAGTATAVPNFALDLCVRKASDAEVARLDLSKWQFALNGAEPVRPSSLSRFAERFGPCGFRAEVHFPVYGLAEGTLLASACRPSAAVAQLELSRSALSQRRIGPAQAQDSTTLVACGMPIPGHDIAIVEPASRRRVDRDEVGEIWLRGPSVAAGYWGRPEESTRTFGARVADTGEGPFLRTGDLGFLRDGELFVVGRLKDVVIVRGVNYYPQDIEQTVERAHADVRPGSSAAVGLDAPEGEQLAVVAEVRPGLLPGELAVVAESIREAVAAVHGIAPRTIALMPPGTLPKTSSGKVQRHAARQGLADGSLETLLTWSASGSEGQSREAPDAAPAAAGRAEAELSTLDFLRHTLASMLGIARDKIDADRELAAYGADSVAMMELLHALQQRFGSQVTPAIFESPTLSALACALDALEPAAHGAGEQAPRASERSAEPFPLALSQQALWFLHQLAPDSAAYHIAMLIERAEGWDAARARRALQELLARHEILTQRLVSGDDGLRHEPGPAPRFTEHATVDFHAASRAPFDLERGPCLRVDFTSKAMLFTVHHAIFDGYSCRVFMEDFLAAYEGRRHTPARPYRDFVRWQAGFLESAEAKRQERYWLQRFATLPPVVDLPADRPRPARLRYRGDTVALRLSAARVQRLSRDTATTPSSVMLSAFFAWQHRVTAQGAEDGDLVIGTPLFGRTQPGFERTIGYFVNMAPIRETVSADLTFCELLVRVNTRMREALGHGDYPFPRLIERLSESGALSRDPGRSPLFQTCFAFQGRTGLPADSRRLSQQEGQFDVELEVFEEGDAYVAYWKFDADLFTRETASRMAGQYVQLLEAALDQPESAVAALPYLTAEERALVARVNATEVSFEASPLAIRGAPDDVALVFPGGQWTYRELDARVQSLAAALAARGVGPETVVAVCLPRGPELVLAIHAILHAGAAYLPLDPDWPAARIAFVLRDAGAVGWFAPASFCHFQLPPWSCALAGEVEVAAVRFASRARTDALAYVLYTSGSTGEPKGVLTEHGALANRIRWMQARYALGPADAVLQKTPVTFDVSVWELIWPLTVGARLVVPPPNAHLDVSALQQIIAREGITTCHFVPSMLAVFLAAAPGSASALRQVFASGEALTPALVARFFARYPDVALHNLYGPTEAAIDVSHWACRPDDDAVPIGWPVANTRLHVLDAAGAEAGLYVPGELVLAGKQLARGYLNRPELTAQRFCEIPGLGRVYRTGDVARRRGDGAIEFLGRRDAQVKLRGVRIELGEVEAVLRRHPGVVAAAVVVHGEQAESQRLVAHVVGDVREEALVQLARAHLPCAFVPSQFVFHDELPLSASGKLDRARLRTPVSPASRGADQAARSAVERIFARFVPTRGADTDFFRAGGTSLQAIRLVEALRKECAVAISLMEFYAAPSPRAILERRAATVPELTAVVRELQSRLPRFARAPAGPPRHLLLTGATGFFGGYLLQAWLQQSDAVLYCLARQAASRLPKHPRIVPVEGDLASIPRALAERIDTVVHNAARVHFLEPYASLAAPNVDGTLAILAFCAAGQAKRLHYVSTVSVFSGSEHDHDSRLDEDAVPSPRGLTSGYAGTKWVAEQLVLSARARGLSATIFRPGTLAGDSRTGSVPRGDLFARFLAGAKQVGAVPDLKRWVEFLPVDWAARALVSLALAGRHDNYHLCHPEPISMRELARRLDLCLVPLATFVRRVQAAADNPLHPLLPLFTEPRGRHGESEAELSQRWPRLDTSHVLRDLALQGWSAPAPAMDEALLRRYLAWLEARSPALARGVDPSVVSPSAEMRGAPTLR